MKTALIIPAAGMGQRLQCPGPKALQQLAGTPMLVRTLERFHSLGLLDSAVIIAGSAYRSEFEAALEQAFPESRFELVEGGADRQGSVVNGLAALEPGIDIVAIHDAARPFVTPESVQASIEAAKEFGAATVAIPVIDTILEADENAFLRSTPERSRLWACQTPQTFRVEVIKAAHQSALAEGFRGTDDASLVRRMGKPVKLVAGSPLNFKVTTPADLALAELVVKEGLA